MASKIVDSSVDCSIVSVPSAYFQSIFDSKSTEPSYDARLSSLDSNTLVMNENTLVTLGLNKLNINWTVLTFSLNIKPFNNLNASSKRLVQVVTNNGVLDSSVVVCEDFLANLNHEKGNGTINRYVFHKEKPSLTITNETLCANALPPKAVKVVLSLFQPNLENSFVDNLLQKYFSYPRYLCQGDIFSVCVSDNFSLGSTDSIKVDTVHFKVCEIQGPPLTNPELFKDLGYFVDSSVTIYQMSSYQGYLPSRSIPVCFKPNLQFLLSDDGFITQLLSLNQNLVPPSFDDTFNTLCEWIEPFVTCSNKVKDMELSPLFLVAGKNGSGKTLVLRALSQYLGMKYYRVDCVTMGGAAPGQAEGKIKAIFSQIKSLAPCILHLSNFETLCQDADAKPDVRVMTCFDQQVKLLSCEWPVIIVATTHDTKCITSDINHWFLDRCTISAPNCEQREEIMRWLIKYNNGSVDNQMLQAVAAQTSGFVFRDLQVLVAAAYKEKFKRSKEKDKEIEDFILSDFTRIIGTMHTAYSDSIGAPKVPSVSWKDVGGLEPLKKEILRSLKSNMFTTGLKRSGLLLHGPPGTGKTLLGKAVATQCGRNFLSVKGPELLNMYVGQSEQNVRDLFELAKVASPCIIFFDELDSLAPNRGRSGDSGGVMDRVVSQLLAEMDDLRSSGDIFILGATNRPDLIDPALLRPGRLDKMLFVGPCEDRNSQLSVLSAVTHKLHLDEDVDMQEVVSQLPTSVSGAQISALCSAAWLSSARQLILSGEHINKTDVVVNKSHFLAALSAVFGQT